MNKNTKSRIAAVTVAALAFAGGGAAIASTQAWSPREESQAVIDDAAEQLGIQPSELSDALKEALKNRIDEAVEDGRLTEEQANTLKERINSGDTPLVVGGFGHEGFGHFGHFGNLEAAASYLGLTEAELREQLVDEKTLADIAKAESKSVDGLVQALVKAAEEKIDDAVMEGRLTKERAAELKQDLKERITDLVNGELRRPPFGFREGFGRGFGFPGGPPAFHGPRA